GGWGPGGGTGGTWPGAGAPGTAAPGKPPAPGGSCWGWTFVVVIRPPVRRLAWVGSSAPPPPGANPGAGAPLPIPRIRAAWVAAWVLAHGKSGPDGKYWTSSCMYRPEGNVIPAYSTWQPTDGRIEPIAKADQSAARRIVDPRGDLIRGKTIATTLLGVSG